VEDRAAIVGRGPVEAAAEGGAGKYVRKEPGDAAWSPGFSFGW